MERVPFGIMADGKVAGRVSLGEPWTPPSDMLVRLGFDPDEPAEVTFRVGENQAWVFDRELIEYALDFPDEVSGDGDVTAMYVVRLSVLRVILSPSDKTESVIVTLPLDRVRVFVRMMREAVPRDAVEYNVDRWLDEFK